MLARKSQLQSGKSSGMTTLERSRLNAQRALALRRNDLQEVEQIDSQLATLAPTRSRQSEEAADLLAKVNERNRKANMEAVRKAELAESERKRRERKLAAAGTPVPVLDPSARLKTVPRLFNSATPTTSRFVSSLLCVLVVDFYFVDREHQVERLSLLECHRYRLLRYLERRMVQRRLRRRLLMRLKLISGISRFLFAGFGLECLLYTYIHTFLRRLDMGFFLCYSICYH